MKTIKKRRKQGKTDYAKRKRLLKSNSPRIVFRKSNRYFVSQYITSKNAQDKIEVSLNSKNLLNYGWPREFQGSLKSIPAAYLFGYLAGKKILEKKPKKIIVDFGMARMIHKSRNYSFLKGLIDSGIEISCEESFFPNQERVFGKNLKKDFSNSFEKIKANINGK